MTCPRQGYTLVEMVWLLAVAKGRGEVIRRSMLIGKLWVCVVVALKISKPDIQEPFHQSQTCHQIFLARFPRLDPPVNSNDNKMPNTLRASRLWTVG